MVLEGKASSFRESHRRRSSIQTPEQERCVIFTSLHLLALIAPAGVFFGKLLGMPAAWFRDAVREPTGLWTFFFRPISCRTCCTRQYTQELFSFACSEKPSLLHNLLLFLGSFFYLLKKRCWLGPGGLQTNSVPITPLGHGPTVSKER